MFKIIRAFMSTTIHVEHIVNWLARAAAAKQLNDTAHEKRL